MTFTPQVTLRPRLWQTILPMTMERPKIAKDWYERAFDTLYPILYAHRTDKAARPEAEFAAAEVRLVSGQRVLDLCCGDGRHMVHLAQRTPHVVGLDYSPTMLSLAARRTGPGLRLVRADMRAIPFRGAFDVLVNFFTSFGYFTSDRENRDVIRGVAGALKPAGRFFIDYVNRAYLERTLVPHSLRHEQGYEIREERWLDAVEQRINKRTLVCFGGENVADLMESVRLYDPEEFSELLHQEGLAVDRMFGDYSGARLAPTQPRMMVVGHKVERHA